MDPLALLGLTGAGALAFANGANDVSKSIATLVGSGEAGYRRAAVLASLAAGAGGALASVWAVELTLLFTKGLLSPEAPVDGAFALAALGGAVGWLLIATRLGLPVSTTHSIAGSVVLTAVAAFGVESVRWAGVAGKVAAPLLVSPFAAFALAFAAFRFLHWLCRRKYCLNCHWAHWLSAIATGLARGLNDTPKIAALGLLFYGLADPGARLAPAWLFLALGAANAAGGILAGLRVTETLARKVTEIDALEGFAANLATSALVVATAVHGFPVSTTHVSSSAIIGMGVRKGVSGVQWGVVRDIAVAWLVTLPAAGIIGAAAYGGFKLVH